MSDRPPIREADLVASVADALQYIAVFHPPSFVQSLAAAYEREESPAARNAIRQILVNSRMAAYGRRPICQDTGTVNVFVKLGLQARIETTRPARRSHQRGGRPRLYRPRQPASRLDRPDPLFGRRNTGDNTPAVVHFDVVAATR